MSPLILAAIIVVLTLIAAAALAVGHRPFGATVLVPLGLTIALLAAAGLLYASTAMAAVVGAVATAAMAVLA